MEYFLRLRQLFFDDNDGNNYLHRELNKTLTFRIKIAPDCVYPIGVSEHDYLDSLDNKQYPFQMCWSLIYRKLKGNRGCTMITDCEFESLVSKLRSVNNGICLSEAVSSFTFNENSSRIEANYRIQEYSGRMNPIDIKERLLFKAGRANAFEVHLQAYIMQNFDNSPLKELLQPCVDLPCWIGNEVSCGVGMQRIDVLMIQERENDIYIKIVELKYISPYLDILNKQLPWYIRWVKDYIAQNYTIQGKTVHIIPCVLAANTTSNSFINACQNFHRAYDADGSIIVEQAEYIGFSIEGNEISFTKVL